MDSREELLLRWLETLPKEARMGTGWLESPPDLSNDPSLKGLARRRYKEVWTFFSFCREELDEHLERGWVKTPTGWRVILCLAISELLVTRFDRDYATVNTWVELGHRHLGFLSKTTLNGVLRGFCRRWQDKIGAMDSAEGLSAFLPFELLKSWSLRGKDALSLSQTVLASPHQYWYPLAVDSYQIALDENLAEEVEDDGNCLCLRDGVEPEDLLDVGPSFFQNLSAAQVAGFAVQWVPAEGSVLDYCAAPGGKSWQMSRIRPNLNVHLYEMNIERRKLLSENPILDYLPNAKVLEAEPEELYDCVLVDAPCSNSGVLVSRAEAIRHYWPNTKTRRDLQGLQAEVLRGAVKRVSLNGVLVYATCSFDKAECEDQVKSFCERGDFVLEKELLIMPTSDGKHGAYAAALRRTM